MFFFITVSGTIINRETIYKNKSINAVNTEYYQTIPDLGIKGVSF